MDKKVLKRHGTILLILTFAYIFLAYVAIKLPVSSSVKIGIFAVSMLLLIIILIVGIAFIIELFQHCVLYCGELAQQKGLPESYKWFGLLLIIGIVILMLATPDQNQHSNVVDELIKYKNLYSQGVITEEEFMKKKRELLEK